MIPVFNHLLDAKSTQEHAVLISQWLGAPVIPANRDKQPLTRGWQKLSREESIKPSRLITFNGAYRNIAVVLGNGLVGVDWDCEDLFHDFLRLNPLAQGSLISQGNRGGTIWFRLNGKHPDKGINMFLVSKDGETEAVGEWRARGCCSVIHGPNLSGGFYSHNQRDPITVTFPQIIWPKGVHPFNPEHGTERAGEDGIDTEDVISPRLIPTLEAAVGVATPRKPHQTDKVLFRFCRALKNVELHRGASLGLADIQKAFDLWYAAALPHLRPNQSKDRYQMEFLHKFMKAKHPLGRGKLLERAMERATSDRPPKAAEQFQDQQLKRLAALLYYLQVETGDQAFFISCRDLGELLGVSKTQASRWLAVLSSPIAPQRLLEVVEPATKTRSTRFRFIGAGGGNDAS